MYGISSQNSIDNPSTCQPRARDQQSKCTLYPDLLSEVVANHQACSPGGQLEVELRLHASVSGNAAAICIFWAVLHITSGTQPYTAWCYSRNPHARFTTLPCDCRGTAAGPATSALASRPKLRLRGTHRGPLRGAARAARSQEPAALRACACSSHHIKLLKSKVQDAGLRTVSHHLATSTQKGSARRLINQIRLPSLPSLRREA